MNINISCSIEERYARNSEAFEFSGKKTLIYFIFEYISLTGQPKLNALNIPTYDRQHQLQARELISQASSLVHELTQALSNFYTYTEQRVQSSIINGETLSDVNEKVNEYSIVKSV